MGFIHGFLHTKSFDGVTYELEVMSSHELVFGYTHKVIYMYIAEGLYLFSRYRSYYEASDVLGASHCPLLVEGQAEDGEISACISRHTRGQSTWVKWQLVVST